MQAVTIYRVSYTFMGKQKDHLCTSPDQADRTAGFYAHLKPTITQEPGGLFEVGDLVEVELHRGGVEDDDGITTGGSWIGPVTGLVDKVFHNNATLVEPSTKRLLQVISRIAGEVGYPYRNARLASKG
jgi:hypothetical protein